MSLPLPEPGEDTPLLSEEQRADLDTIKRVLECTSVEGVEVRSGFVSEHCGCKRDSPIYKTIVQGLPAGLMNGSFVHGVAGRTVFIQVCPGHIHHETGHANHRCAKCDEECLATHKGVVQWVRAAVNDYMRAKHGLPNRHMSETIDVDSFW